MNVTANTKMLPLGLRKKESKELPDVGCAMGLVLIQEHGSCGGWIQLLPQFNVVRLGQV